VNDPKHEHSSTNFTLCGPLVWAWSTGFCNSLVVAGDKP
jgi:hypothetical protein